MPKGISKRQRERCHPLITVCVGRANLGSFTGKALLQEKRFYSKSSFTGNALIQEKDFTGKATVHFTGNALLQENLSGCFLCVFYVFLESFGVLCWALGVLWV